MNYLEAKSAGFPAPKVKLTDDDLPRIAAEIGCHEDVVHALIEVESGASASDKDGRLPMLFEPHVFYRNLPAEKREGAVNVIVNINGTNWPLCYPTWRKGYPKTSYPRLFKAMEIDEQAALKACSWGRSQILGENHKLVGYPTVFEMVAAFSTDEDDHIEAMIRFVKSVKLDDDLRRIEEIAKTRTPTPADWAPVAAGYNGKGYASHNYHGRLANAFEKWSKIKDTEWSPDKALKPEVDKKDAKDAGPIIVGTGVGGGLWAYLRGWGFGEWAITVLVLVAIAVVVYLFLLRPVIRRARELVPVLSALGQQELTFWDRARVTLKGMKSYLWGRLLAITGGALALLQMTNFVDLSSVLPPFTYFGMNISASVYIPVIVLPVLAWINNKLAETRDTSPEQLAAALAKPEPPSDGSMIAVANLATPMEVRVAEASFESNEKPRRKYRKGKK